MSSDTSSDNSDIASRIQKIADKHEESGSKVIVHKTVCTVNVLDDSYDNKKLSELSISSSMSSSDSISSYCDSVDTSDLEEEETNRLYEKIEGRMQYIKTSHDQLFTTLFDKKINEIESKIVEVKLGTAEEYCKPSQELRKQKESRLAVSEALRDCKLTNVKHKYEAEKQAIIQNFENNKEILYDTIKADLEKKIQLLEEERNAIDIHASLCSRGSLKCSGHGRHLYGHVQSKRKPVIVSGPCIVYNLREHEKLEDWIPIKKSLLLSKRKENSEHRYKPYN